MGSIWIKNEAGQWDAVPTDEWCGAAVSVCRFGAGTEKGVALLTRVGSIVYINGQRLRAGMRVLQHKDEMQVCGDRYFYSAEMRPQVVAYEAVDNDHSPKCPTCRVAICDGELIVQCPRCSRIYHQNEDKRCWTYREKCSFCQHPTSLSGEPVWRPELEESDA